MCLRTVISSRLSHRELRSSLKESHSFLSLPAGTTMASSQGTSVSSNSFSRWAYYDIFLIKYHFYSTFYAFFPSFRITLWPTWLANSKQQPCFFHHIHTHKKTNRTYKNRQKFWWKTCVLPENIQFSFSCSYLHS